MRERFKNWLLKRNFTEKTCRGYLAALGADHFGLDVFQCHDTGQLEALYADFGLNGQFAETGNKSHGTVRNALGRWLDFQKEQKQDQTRIFRVVLTDGAIKNGYISVNGNSQFFSAEFIADNTGNSQSTFTLIWPDGERVNTRVLGQYGRIQARFNKRFSAFLPNAVVTIIQDSEQKNCYLISVNNPQETPAQKQMDESKKLSPLNQILFGPPGTGKTYHTINRSLAILDPEFLDEHQNNRGALTERFRVLLNEERIRFVTFHQSFSYEDFVEGLRAENNETGQLEYRVEPGVFKRICDDARVGETSSERGIRANPRIWKISINGTGNNPTKAHCLDSSEIRIGWGLAGDLSLPMDDNTYYQSLKSGDKGTLQYFTEEMSAGDIVLCIHSADQIGAVGVISGDYRFEAQTPAGIRDDYHNVRPVKWLYRDLQLPIQPLNDNKSFTQKTIYQIDRFSWGDLLAYLNKNGCTPIEQSDRDKPCLPYVLIIDEINRGNISRIFGELITLIEPSKRDGSDEALSATLPYSKIQFSVPDNVYLIGTMNTADRSLAGLDIALRRRFSFKEMPPRPDLLDKVTIQGINIGGMLRIMNQRITVLLDRDHCIGHAYFMSLDNDSSLDQLAVIFKQNIIPLLQEYFFENWERIRWILNDQSKVIAHAFIVEDGDLALSNLFPKVQDKLRLSVRWRLNQDAFHNIESYRGIGGIQPGQG
ncbi:MAG: AAA family ATPase [Iodobacter sp.]